MHEYEEYIDPAIWGRTDIKIITDCKLIPSELNGGLINYILERADGTLWACTENLATQINFCPVTGYEAKVKLILSAETRH